MRWRAWYTDGRVFSSEEVRFQSLPETGLIVFVHYKDTGRTFYTGMDWLWLEDGVFRYTPSGEWGTWQPRPNVSCRSCIKRGDGVPDEEFWRVCREVAQEPVWP